MNCVLCSKWQLVACNTETVNIQYTLLKAVPCSLFIGTWLGNMQGWKKGVRGIGQVPLSLHVTFSPPPQFCSSRPTEANIEMADQLDKIYFGRGCDISTRLWQCHTTSLYFKCEKTWLFLFYFLFALGWCSESFFGDFWQSKSFGNFAKVFSVTSTVLKPNILCFLSMFIEHCDYST